MMLTPEKIAETAAYIKSLGVPDDLNTWLRLTPQALASNHAARQEDDMARTTGPREQALREMREQRRDRRPGYGKPLPPEQALAKLPVVDKRPPAQPKEDVVAKSTKRKTASKKAKAKPATRKTARKIGAVPGVDRSPLAVGTFIAARGADGCPMAEIQKHFKMLAHSLRSKMHAARHKLGFKIEYDAARAVYVGEAPKAAGDGA